MSFGNGKQQCIKIIMYVICCGKVIKEQIFKAGDYINAFEGAHKKGS